MKRPRRVPRFVLAAAAAAAVVTAPAAIAHATAPQLSLITEPSAGIGPILTAIDQAHHSIDLVMYELNDPRVDAALAAAEHRGVDVRVLLNRGYYGAHTDYGRPAYNLPAFNDLRAHRVPVRWTPARFALTHEKALVVDGRTAYILTFNFTEQYYATSRDFGIVDRTSSDVEAIATTFDADWNNHAITAPPGADLVWSPGAQDEQVAFIDHAHGSLDVENEEMDDSAVEEALEAAARRGVAVRVVMTANSEWDAAFAALRAAGVQVRTYREDAPLYIHAKLMLTPTQAFVGSQNFSSTSLQENRELGITFSPTAILHQLVSTFASDFAGAQPFRP